MAPCVALPEALPLTGSGEVAEARSLQDRRPGKAEQVGRTSHQTHPARRHRPEPGLAGDTGHRRTPATARAGAVVDRPANELLQVGLRTGDRLVQRARVEVGQVGVRAGVRTNLESQAPELSQLRLRQVTGPAYPAAHDEERGAEPGPGQARR